MNTNKKRALPLRAGIITLILCLLLGLTGCAPSAEKILEKAVESSQSVDSMRVAMDMDMTMGAQGVSMAMDIGMDLSTVSIQSGGQKAKGVLTIGMMGLTVEADVYVDESYTYLGMGGEWMRQPNDTEEAAQLQAAMQPATTMEEYSKHMSEFTLLDDEELDGVACYKISAQMDGEALRETLGEALSTILGDSGSGELVLGEIEDLPATLWIDKDSGHFAKVEIDVTTALQEIMNATEATGGENVDVSKYFITMRITEIDAVEDFEIPPEALAAPLDDAGMLF